MLLERLLLSRNPLQFSRVIWIQLVPSFPQLTLLAVQRLQYEEGVVTGKGRSTGVGYRLVDYSTSTRLQEPTARYALRMGLKLLMLRLRVAVESMRYAYVLNATSSRHESALRLTLRILRSFWTSAS